MPPLPETRISLVLRLAGSSDVQAWQEFAELYAPAIYGLAIRRGLQPADAEDVTQEVLFGVARAIERFQPDSERASFRTWLSRIARNLIVDFMRRRERQPATGDPIVEESQQLIQEEQGFELEYRNAIFQLAARRVKNRVNRGTWQAFWRSTIEHDSMETVAAELDMTLGNLYVARSRVVKLLREEAARLQRVYGGDSTTSTELPFSRASNHDSLEAQER